MTASFLRAYLVFAVVAIGLSALVLLTSIANSLSAIKKHLFGDGDRAEATKELKP